MRSRKLTDLRFGFRHLILAGSLLGAAARLPGEPYIAELGNDPTVEWVGVASLTDDAAGAVAGELCLVRKEYVDRPALPRTLVRVPVRGVRANGKLQLDVPSIAGGPNFPGGKATLERYPNDDDPERAFEWWDFGSRNDFWTESGEPRRSSVTQYLRLRRGPNLWREVSGLSGPDFKLVAVYANRNAQENDDYSYYKLEEYDRMSPAQAIKFEKSKLFVDLFDVGYVNVLVDTGKFGGLKDRLDRLGHGARILNAELADCPPAPMLTSVLVPSGFELWYTRRLQSTGLVIAAYPEALARDPSWSEAFPVASAVIAAALRNPKLDTPGKYKAIWLNLEQRLKHFAQARRPGYLSSGSIVSVGTGAEFMFRAELAGRALAVCDPNRWEKITVNATVNAFDRHRGRADMALNFSDGYVAKGKQPPAESRWRDNRIADSDLAKLQELFIAFLKGNRTATAKCLR